MAGLSGILYIAVMGFVVFSIINKALKKTNSQTAQNKFGPKAAQAGKAVRPKGYTNYRPHKDIISVSRDMGDSKGSSTLRDDRNNDWLARQLRDEHKAFKATSEMFDLKIEHASHCDAKLLEQFHKRNCSAEGVDLANGKTAYHK